MKWMASIAIITGATMIAQVTPRFETATIQASPDAEGRSRYVIDSQNLTLQNLSLKDCVRIAYDVKIARLAPGAPKWIETQRFDIEGKSAGPVDDSTLKAMLRALLLERFKLAFHRETKMVPGYALVVAKSGLKIHAADPGPSRMSTGRGSIGSENASMPSLAQALSDVLSAPVVDATARPGVFTFTLEWTPDPVTPGALTADDQDPSVLPDMPKGPSLLAAIEDQLGLKLERRRVPLDVLIIDRAERLQ